MSEHTINSKEYWNQRFITDWSEFGGSQQTVFFANLLCEMLPAWLLEKIERYKYKACDMGCALGEGVDVLSKFLNIEVEGIDFSEDAIQIAKEKFPHYKFQQGDITSLSKDTQYNIVFCSNVLEHFSNPWVLVENLTSIATDYIVLQVPFREELCIEEHLWKFNTDNIPVQINDFSLVYSDTVDGANIQDSFYPDQQILLIFSKHREDINGLNNLTEGISRSDIRKVRKELEKKIENSISEKNKKYIEELTTQNLELKHELRKKEEVIINIKNELYRLAGSRYFKLLHFILRLRQQGLSKDSIERKKYRKWLKSKIKSGVGDNDKRYHPLLTILNLVEERSNNLRSINTSGNFVTINQKNILTTEYSKHDVIVFAVIDFDFRYQRPQHLAAIYASKGHRVFYVNANYKGKNSVEEIQSNLYIVNFDNSSFDTVYSADWSKKLGQLSNNINALVNNYCIRDAVTIVDYPNWVQAAKYLRDKYGFKIVTDYMDDFTGFNDTVNDDVIKNCFELLKISDSIIASSQFLYEIAIKYNKNVELIRNGTEFTHFNTAINKSDHKKQAIGYYGAIADWFDVRKICFVAKHLPECDIVLIGDVTDGRKDLEKYTNIKLMGEIPYGVLPQYLKEFDVCLIPFDTTTDLIKATNPVKFYEYLSAGKKIVATEIPELLSFQDEFLYMSNSDEQFLEYIKLCLSGDDTLSDQESCIDFARSNDWEKRYEEFSCFCKAQSPKVSVIVLTYNNLQLNKVCIKSILENTGYPNFELIIVDNNSTDGTREYLHSLSKQENSNVKIIYNEDNLGFAGGNNIGIKNADGDYLILLNNDTIVTRGWMSALVKHMELNKDIGMCGPVTNSIGNEAKICVDYYDITSLLEFSFLYTTQNINCRFEDPEVLALFCTIIRREIIEKCGLLDECYKVGMFEDDDYAESVKSAGYRLSIAEDAFIHHFDGGSFKKLENTEYKRIFDSNRKYFEEKWNIKWKMKCYRKGVEWYSNQNIDLRSVLEKN